MKLQHAPLRENQSQNKNNKNENANPNSNDMLAYYSTEQIEKYGVVGIELLLKTTIEACGVKIT